MDGIQSLQNPFASQSNEDVIVKLHAQTVGLRKALKRVRVRVAEDEEAHRVASRRKEIIERQLNEEKCSVDSMQSQINTQVALCSAQLLEPILHSLQTLLPLELREMIYEDLVDTISPKVVPESEGSKQDAFDMWGNSRATLNPFKDEAVFDSQIMGPQISNEIRKFYIQRTPLFFRSLNRAENLSVLLDTVVSAGKQVRDFTHHLRVYLRCETFNQDVTDYLGGASFICTSREDERNQGELRLYDTYRWRLKALESLPFEERKIKVEICVFHTYDTASLTGSSEDFTYPRPMYNMLEAVKPTYFRARDREADITVRCENFHTGKGSDVTWILDMDADDWKVSKEPVYALFGQEEPAARRNWLEKITAACELQSPSEPSINISWKHELFDGTFPCCLCEPCKEASIFHLPDDPTMVTCTFDFDSFLNGDNTAGASWAHVGDFDFNHVPQVSSNL